MMADASKCPPLPAGSVEFGAIEAAAKKGDEALAKAVEDAAPKAEKAAKPAPSPTPSPAPAPAPSKSAKSDD